MKIRINDINVGERRREDIGDIQGLADSIKKYGLLHPIVVDDQNRLVAGGRRLEACKVLGWEEVEARSLGELTEKELRAIELEENLRRKDLTEIEKSKKMVELAELKISEIKSRSESEEVFNEARKKLGGRPAKIDSQAKIADAIGVPLQTLRDAQAHVEAVKKYPELVEVPKTHAIKIAKELDDSLKEGKEEAKELFQGEDATEITGNISFMLEPDYLPPAERIKRKAFIRLSKLFYRFSVIASSIAHWQGMEEAVKEEEFNSLVHAYNRLSDIQKTINSWIGIIGDEISQRKNIRRVK